MRRHALVAAFAACSVLFALAHAPGAAMGCVIMLYLIGTRP